MLFARMQCEKWSVFINSTYCEAIVPLPSSCIRQGFTAWVWMWRAALGHRLTQRRWTGQGWHEFVCPSGCLLSNMPVPILENGISQQCLKEVASNPFKYTMINWLEFGQRSTCPPVHSVLKQDFSVMPERNWISSDTIQSSWRDETMH